MAEQFIQQPDGKWAIYSTITDQLTAINLTEEELITLTGEYAKERAEDNTRHWLRQWKEAGGKLPRHWITWEKALQNSLKNPYEKDEQDFVKAIKTIQKEKKRD